ncbi:tyrosine-type recombinase/integrase [Streptococcus thoraltensis]|uniref:tyrosine-type recombinase/integrase n=1 Tax=Streptococcus thoraltensis TaxID=55085 RepID=UPI0003770ED9|nr:site-specific integrase [Streptococcus thoraltensis]QBX31150.1 integrase [Streptococcus phage Javan616]
MWIEELSNGKYKYFERYKDPYTEKWKKVSITLDSRTSRAKKEAQKLLEEKIAEKLQNLTTTDLLFENIIDDWWNLHKKSIKPSTEKTMIYAVNEVRKNFAPGIKIKNITPKYTQQYFTNSAYNLIKLRKHKSVLSMVFNYALDLELILSNPIERVRLPKKVITYEEMERIEDKYLEQEELQRLLEAMKNYNRGYYVARMAEFMSLNGCRVGEAGALKFENYDKENRTITINGTLDPTRKGSEGVKSTPKTAASIRVIDLTNKEIEIIEEFIQLHDLRKHTNPNYKDMGFIFVSSNGIPIGKSSLNILMKKANETLDEPIKKPLHPHILRHTLISTLAEHNIPLKAITQRVGHKDNGKTTMEIYTHVTKNIKSQVVDVLDKLYQ